METRNVVGQLQRGTYHKGPFGTGKYICLVDKLQAFQGPNPGLIRLENLVRETPWNQRYNTLSRYSSVPYQLPRCLAPGFLQGSRETSFRYDENTERRPAHNILREPGFFWPYQRWSHSSSFHPPVQTQQQRLARHGVELSCCLPLLIHWPNTIPTQLGIFAGL